jgi:hypothetical protein
MEITMFLGDFHLSVSVPVIVAIYLLRSMRI